MFNLIPESYDLQDVLTETGDMLGTLAFLLDNSTEDLDGRFKSGFASMLSGIGRCIDDVNARDVKRHQLGSDGGAAAASDTLRPAERGSAETRLQEIHREIGRLAREKASPEPAGGRAPSAAEDHPSHGAVDAARLRDAVEIEVQRIIDRLNAPDTAAGIIERLEAAGGGKSA